MLCASARHAPLQARAVREVMERSGREVAAARAEAATWRQRAMTADTQVWGAKGQGPAGGLCW